MNYKDDAAQVMKLPVKHPIITGLPDVAHPMSIVCAYENTLPWIYNNFIIPICRADGRHDHVLDLKYVPKDFKDFIFLEHKVISRTILKKFINDPINFIVNLINHNNYIILSIDQKFILNTDYDRPHPLFIYGYDMNRNIFNVADFTLTGTGKYSFQEASIDNVLKGFFHYSEENIKKIIDCFKFNTSLQYDFDVQLLKQSFNYYINPSEFDYIDRVIPNSKRHVFGIDIYNMIIDHFSKGIYNDTRLIYWVVYKNSFL